MLLTILCEYRSFVHDVLPCDKARQWLSPIEMSTTLVVASSSTSFGLRAVASDEPQPRHAPHPQAYTYEKKHEYLFNCDVVDIISECVKLQEYVDRIYVIDVSYLSSGGEGQR